MQVNLNSLSLLWPNTKKLLHFQECFWSRFTLQKGRSFPSGIHRLLDSRKTEDRKKAEWTPCVLHMECLCFTCSITADILLFLSLILEFCPKCNSFIVSKNVTKMTKMTTPKEACRTTTTLPINLQSQRRRLYKVKFWKFVPEGGDRKGENANRICHARLRPSINEKSLYSVVHTFRVEAKPLRGWSILFLWSL